MVNPVLPPVSVGNARWLTNPFTDDSETNYERTVAWDHVRRRLPFLADFLGNILTEWRLERRVGGEWGGGWGAWALVMGQLHRAPPTATCAQVARARALCESVYHLFRAALFLALVTSLWV